VKTVPLAEVASINPRGESVSAESEVSFVGMAELDAVSAAARPLETRTFSEVSKGYTVFRDGDVLAAKITPCWENGKVGQAHLNHAVGVGSTEFHVLRPGPELDDRYLLHFLRQPLVRKAGELRMTGSAGQKRVPPGFLQGLEIPLPPLTDQRRIAGILDHADALRTKRRKVLKQFDTLGSSTFDSMFTCGSHPTVVLGDIAGVKGGKRLPKGAPYADGPTNHPYIRVTDLRGGAIRTDNLSFLTPEVQRKIARYTVDEGDVVISIAGTIGLTAAVPAALAGANLTENAAKIVPAEPDAYSGPWLARALQSRALQHQIAGKVGQVTIGKLALFRIEQLELPLPPLALQQQFVDRVAKIDALRAGVQRAGTAEDELFSSLQARAFRGEL